MAHVDGTPQSNGAPVPSVHRRDTRSIYLTHTYCGTVYSSQISTVPPVRSAGNFLNKLAALRKFKRTGSATRREDLATNPGPYLIVPMKLLVGGVCVCACVCNGEIKGWYIHMYIRAHARTHARTHTHTHARTHTHTHAHRERDFTREAHAPL